MMRSPSSGGRAATLAAQQHWQLRAALAEPSLPHPHA